MQMNKPTLSSIEFQVSEHADVLVARENTYGDDGKVVASDEVFHISLDDLRARNLAETQRSIGRLVLTFLDSRSPKGLRLPRDIEDENKLDEEHFSHLSKAAKSNDLEAVYDMGTSLIARGIANEDWNDITQGEEFLKQAVAAGLPAAIQYQSETWELIRPRLEQKLKP
jgi:hypothetical protein